MQSHDKLYGSQKSEGGLTYKKLLSLTGKSDLTEKQAEDIITSLKILAEIILDFQQEKETIEKSNLDHLLKHAA